MEGTRLRCTLPNYLICSTSQFNFIFSAHWYLAVVCYPRLLLGTCQTDLEQQRLALISDGDQMMGKQSERCCVLFFDSLNDRRQKSAVLRMIQQ